MAKDYSGLLYGKRFEGAEARRRKRRSVLHLLRRRGSRLRIEAYHGYGTTDKLYLKGRVLRDPGTRKVDANSGRIYNLKNTLRRALTDEVPYARVRASHGNDHAEGQADSEGFFGIVLPVSLDLHPSKSWYEVELELLDPEEPADKETARVLVPPSSARLGVISDIDDTVVHTAATNLFRMLRIVLLTNAHTRMPFDHVDALYRALREGSSGGEENPVFYLSSSPWNFFDLLEEFFRVHDIPEGPLFLRDWNFSPRKLLGMGHQEHKLVRLRHLFDVYPDLPWVLIGDSGQEDPEIYRTIVHDYGDRILAVYIRNVTTGPDRVAAVEELAKEVGQAGSELLLSDDTAASAVHAAERGWLDSAALDAVIAAVNSS
jgi:phosphatidate phosphatase APP1